MSERLAEIKERLAKAPDGPWKAEYQDYGDEVWFGGDDEGLYTFWDADGRCLAYLGTWKREVPEEASLQEGATELISHAPSDLAWLIAEVESLRARVAAR